MSLTNQIARSAQRLVEKCPDSTGGERPLQMPAMNAAELLKEDEEELGSCRLSK